LTLLSPAATPGAEIKRFDSTADMVLALKNGKVDVAFFDLTLSYSEKQDSLELLVESIGEYLNPFVENVLPDQLGTTIIKNLSENLEFQRVNNRNKVSLTVKK